MQPAVGDTWVALTDEQLPVGTIGDWAVRPGCGGLVLFSGTVRDHAEHRTGVTSIFYEAYAEQVEPRLLDIAKAARARWPDLGAIAILHRVGEIALGESSVVIAVSAPHRAEAFDGARYCIDALKATVPIWKKESWDGGEDWGLAATDLSELADLDLDGKS